MRSRDAWASHLPTKAKAGAAAAHARTGLGLFCLDDNPEKGRRNQGTAGLADFEADIMADTTWTPIIQALESAVADYASGNVMALSVTMPDGTSIRYRSFEELDRALSIARRRELGGNPFNKVSFQRPA